MKRPKITENPSEGQVKDSANVWSNKAVSRAAENAALRKRIKVLTDSREGYKTKCKILAERLVQKNATTEEVFLEAKASGHQYSLAVSCLILELYQYGAMSLRGCRHAVGCMLVALGLSACLPSHSTVRNWLCKGGLHRSETAAVADGEYVVYVDESIVFGREKILLILSVPVATFVVNCKTYLAQLSVQSAHLARPHLLVSSDIIESFFGKFKTKINANNRSGLTAFVFTIANFSESFSVEETKNALESVQLKDLKLVKNREKPA